MVGREDYPDTFCLLSEEAFGFARVSANWKVNVFWSDDQSVNAVRNGRVGTDAQELELITPTCGVRPLM